MIKQFLKEGSIYSLSNFATKGISLLLIPFYTSYFSPSDYGILDYLAILSGIINAFLSLQIGQGISRYLSDDQFSELEKKKIGATGINLLFLTYFVGGGILLFTQTFWKELVSTTQNEFTAGIFQLMILNTCINAFFYQLGIHLRYKRKTTAFAWISFLQTLANLGLILFLVLFQKMGIEAIYWASTVIAPIVVGVQLYLLRKDYLFYLGKKEIRMLLQFSLPLIPSALSLLVLDVTDRFLIAQKLSLNALGVYSVAAKFAAIITLLISSFSMALGPIVLENYRLSETRKKLNFLFQNYLSLGGICVLFLALFAAETIQLFTNKAYSEAVAVLPILYFTSFLGGISMFSMGIFLSKKTYWIALISVFSALLNYLLNSQFIPIYGISGAAYATLIATIFQVGLTYYWSNQFYPFASNYKTLSKSVILLSILVLVTYLPALTHIFPIILYLKWLVAIGLILLSVKFVKKLSLNAF